jgi:hypothetical protein
MNIIKMGEKNRLTMGKYFFCSSLFSFLSIISLICTSFNTGEFFTPAKKKSGKMNPDEKNMTIKRSISTHRDDRHEACLYNEYSMKTYNL